MATSGRSGHEHFSAIHIAQTINRIAGGIVIAPWQIDSLPLDWIATFFALEYRYPKIKKGIDTHKAKIEQWKDDNPFYKRP